jgi:hypothetical protein
VASAVEPRPTRRRRRAALIAAGVTVFVVGTALVAGAQAEKPSGQYQGTLDALVAFLQRDQNKDGGFGGEAGAESNADFSAWVALALAAASVNPHDQKDKTESGAKDVYSYLAEQAEEGHELSTTTDFERNLMVVNTAEVRPRPLGGVDLVKGVLEGRIESTGAFSHELHSNVPGVNDTIFAILALAPIKEPAIEANVRKAAEWVIEEQNADGSWPSTCPKSLCTRAGVEPPGDTDMTGAALEALNAAGMHDTEAQTRALVYLHEAQLPDGGWPQQIHDEQEQESNVGSTAWVVQGIWAAGGNPEAWVKEGNEPLGYMASLQQPDGHIKYKKSQDMNGVWMTAYAGPAFAGFPLPIPYVPPEVPSEPEEEAGAETTPNGGGKPEFVRTQNEGGDTFKQGEGVNAGGGGDGAPLFSRPKPQGKGKTPGGARVVRRQKLEARDHSHNRRGANQHQPRGIENVEPRERSEADQEVAAVSATAATGGEGGGGGDEGSGPGAKGAPLPVKGAATTDPTASHEEVSGTVIGSPEGTHGKLAFGAPGLKSAGGGASDGLGAAIAIGVAVLLAAGFGAGLEQRRGRLA